MSLQSLLSGCLNEGHRVRRLESNHRFFSLIISVLLPVEGLMPAGSFQSVKVCTESAHLSDTIPDSGTKWAIRGVIVLHWIKVKPSRKKILITYCSSVCYPAYSSNVKFHFTNGTKAPQKLKLSMLCHIQFIRSMGHLPSIWGKSIKSCPPLGIWSTLKSFRDY